MIKKMFVLIVSMTCLLNANVLPDTVKQIGVFDDTLIAYSFEGDKFSFYDSLKIFKNGKVLFKFSSPYFVESYQGKVADIIISDQKDYYIVKLLEDVNTTPSYLVLQPDSSKIRVLDTIKNVEPYIFGDIDFDGYFEIGGLTEYSEDERSKCDIYKSFFKIFKIKNVIIEDTKLENLFRNMECNVKRK